MYEPANYEAEALNDARTELEAAVIGQKIVSTRSEKYDKAVLQLSNGKEVVLEGYGDCCAWAEAEVIEFILNTEHAITGVTTDDSDSSLQTWFIFAEDIPVVTLYATAGEGSGYYAFGITVTVREVEA